MGKKQNRKAHLSKIKQSIEKLTNNDLSNVDNEFNNNENNYIINNNSYNSSKTNESTFAVTEIDIMISKLKSNNIKDMENASYLLATVNYSNVPIKIFKKYNTDNFYQAMIDCFKNSALINYADELLDVPIKTNIIAGFINLLSTPIEENEFDTYNTNTLCPESLLISKLSIIEVLNDSIKNIIIYFINYSKSNFENDVVNNIFVKNKTKLIKLLKIILDLLDLFSEILVIKDVNDNYFASTISILCDVLINNEKLSKISSNNKELKEFNDLNIDIIYTVNNLLGLKFIKNLNNYNNINLYYDYLNKQIINNSSNYDILLNCKYISFYYLVINYHYHNNLNYSVVLNDFKIAICYISNSILKLKAYIQENTKKINEYYYNIMECNNKEQLEDIDVNDINIENNINETNNSNNIIRELNNKSNSSLMLDIKNTLVINEVYIKILIQNIKIINDIFVNFNELKTDFKDNKINDLNNNNNNNKEEEEWEEMSEETLDEEEAVYNDLLSKTFVNANDLISSITSNDMLFFNIILELGNFSFTNSLLLADSSEAVSFEELNNELEYCSISFISNITLNLTNKFESNNNSELVKIVLSFAELILNKLSKYNLSNNEISNKSNLAYNNNNKESDLSLLLICLRNIIDYNNDIKKSIKITDILALYTANSNNKVIKMSLIDLIGKIFYTRKDICIQDIETVCNYLLELFDYENNDIEILCHLFNALMDVFAVDEYNDILIKYKIIFRFKETDVVRNLKKKIKTEYKEKSIDRETKEYCLETSNNLKEFILYKTNKNC